MTDDDTPDETDSQPTTQPVDAPRHVPVEVPLDEHRAGMWADLVDRLGEDQARALLGRNLADSANDVVTTLYDNRKPVERAMTRVTSPGDATEGGTDDR